MRSWRKPFPLQHPWHHHPSLPPGGIQEAAPTRARCEAGEFTPELELSCRCSFQTWQREIRAKKKRQKEEETQTCHLHLAKSSSHITRAGSISSLWIPAVSFPWPSAAGHSDAPPCPPSWLPSAPWKIPVFQRLSKFCDIASLKAPLRTTVPRG